MLPQAVGNVHDVIRDFSNRLQMLTGVSGVLNLGDHLGSLNCACLQRKGMRRSSTCTEDSTTPSSCQGRLALRATRVYAADMRPAQAHMRTLYGRWCSLHRGAMLLAMN